MAVQSYWSNTPTQVQAPNVNAAAALTINGWDNLSKNISNIQNKLIEEPATKEYLHALNNGQDISGFDPSRISSDVLAKTNAIRGQQLINEAAAFENEINRLNEANAVANQAGINKAIALNNAGKYADAGDALLSLAPNMRADVFKTYLAGLDPRKGQRADIATAIQQSTNDLNWSKFRAQEARQAMYDQELQNNAMLYGLLQGLSPEDQMGILTTAYDYARGGTLNSNYAPYASYIEQIVPLLPSINKRYLQGKKTK